MATPYKQVMEDLLKGQEFATRLQGLLRESPKAEPIMEEILQTFSRAIHAMDAAKVGAGAGGAGTPCSEGQSDVTCGGKRKAGAGADGRGGCRRRTQQSSGVTTTTKDLEDGQAWRKYGQKDIQNSTYPKAYFRCTHKYDQGCMAQRQVQRCDDDPDMYRVTYIGVHTCRDPATISPHIIHQTSSSDLKGSCLISFVANASTTTTSDLKGLQCLKPDADQEEVRSSLTPGCSAVEAARSTAAAAAAAGPDQGDVTSSLHWSGGELPMGGVFIDDTFDLDGMFDFPH